MSSSERNIERRAKMMAVMDAAEVWARLHMSGVSREDFMAAQARLSEAVRDWLAYRGKGRVVGSAGKDNLDDRG